MTKRLFLAIPLPPDLLDKLDNWQREYKKQYQIKWAPKENLHITLAFLGDIVEEDIFSLEDKLEAVLAKFSCFEIFFDKIIQFPPHHPNMIWADFKNSQQFIDLTTAMGEAVKDFIDFKLLQSQKTPLAHATLARFRQPVFIKEFKQIDYKNKILMSKIILMESDLSGSKPIYTPLKEFKLKT